MPTNRTRRNAPEGTTETVSTEAAEMPETGESDTPVEAAPETDEATEPEIPALPDGFTPEQPLVAKALEMVLAAEAHKDDPTPIADFVAAADNLFSVATGFDVVATAQAVEGGLEFANETLGRMRLFADFLRPSVETVNRTEGNDLLEALVALAKVPMAISSETDKAAIPILSARWRASAPKRAKSAGAGSRGPRGESDIPSLNVRVRYECGTCGKKFSTRKDNLNSARNECIKHSRTHGQNKANGTNDFKELTDGLFRTGLTDGKKSAKPDELVHSIQRGGWRFIRDEAA